MKLGNLKAAIRATKGNPVIKTKLFADGPTLTLALQKTALLEELDRAYPGGKAVETDLTFDEKTCVLSSDAGLPSNRLENPLPAAPEPLGEAVDLDLTGLDLDITAAPVTQSTGLDDLFV
ncbi:hypothetical protein RCJOLI_56 [Rhodobacter phage RcJoli]|nr:hypothetical protein RCJOLI_56 [Rhodobacter phage RcJoli]